jgi:hypothetical protein
VDLLVVTPGEPGSYGRALSPGQRPRNVTTLKELARPATPEPWPAGSYVLVGTSGKRAHWTGEEWKGGPAPDEEPAPEQPTEAPAEEAPEPEPEPEPEQSHRSETEQTRPADQQEQSGKHSAGSFRVGVDPADPETPGQ